MDSKKYLDKVIEHLVRGTKIDYDKGEIILPFTTNATPFRLSPFLYHSYSSPSSPFSLPFFKYCVNHFGLTPEEIEYVYKQYKEIIKDKIEDGQ